MPISRTLRQAARLSLADWWLIAESWFTALYVFLLIRGLPFSTWYRLLLSPESGADENADEGKIKRIARCFAIAANRHPCRLTCLHRSIALLRLYRRRNIPVRLRMGIRKQDETMEGHAWLTMGQRVLNDRQDIADAYTIVDLSSHSAYLNT